MAYRRRLVVVGQDAVPPFLPRAHDDDKFHDECGVFGVYGHGEAANIAYLGMHALQHRGQESAGVVTTDGEQLYAYRAMGLVQDAFKSEHLAKLPGRAAIGHVRYSTAGGSHLRNAQPFAVDYARGSVAVCHNGNLTNAEALRAELEESGSIFSSTSDTEVIVHLVAHSKAIAIEDRVMDALAKVHGAYSLLFLTEDTLIACRDPRGIRPLAMGILPGNRDAHVFASEPCAFDLIGAQHVRDVEAGELIVVDSSGVRSLRIPNPPGEVAPEQKNCVFEYVYFARPDSHLDGKSVYEVRKELGRVLAKEAPPPRSATAAANDPSDIGADVVIPVPDSGVPSAIGYASALGLPFEMGLIRSHYVGRTFIEPQQSIRHFGVRLKLNTVESIIAGKRVVIIDDSIVRGTTSRKIVKMVRDAGAREVHLRISSPPVEWPCYYGIDTPTRRELIASSHSKDEIARYVTADSLDYVSIEGMVKAVGKPEKSLCHACFSGKYPIAIEETKNKRTNRIVGI